jgi:hypothetical protein
MELHVISLRSAAFYMGDEIASSLLTLPADNITHQLIRGEFSALSPESGRIASNNGKRSDRK